MVWWALRYLSVEEWVLTAIQSRNSNTKSEVKVNWKCSEEIEGPSYICTAQQYNQKRHVLSPLLFILVPGTLSREFGIGIQWDCMTWSLKPICLRNTYTGLCSIFHMRSSDHLLISLQMIQHWPSYLSDADFITSNLNASWSGMAIHGGSNTYDEQFYRLETRSRYSITPLYRLPL